MKKILLIFLSILILLNGLQINSFASPTLVISEGVLSYIAYLASLAGIKTYDEFNRRSMLENTLSYLSIEQYGDIDRYYNENAVVENGKIAIAPNVDHLKGFIKIYEDLNTMNSYAAQIVADKVITTVHDSVQMSYDAFCDALDTADAVIADVVMSGTNAAGKVIDGIFYYASSVATAFSDYLFGRAYTSERSSKLYLNPVKVIDSLSDYVSFSQAITDVKTGSTIGTISGNMPLTKVFVKTGSYINEYKLIEFEFYKNVYEKTENSIRVGRLYKGRNWAFSPETIFEGHVYDISEVSEAVLDSSLAELWYFKELATNSLTCVPLVTATPIDFDDLIDKFRNREHIEFPAVPSYYPSVVNPALDWVLENKWDAGVVINPSIDKILEDAAVISTPIITGSNWDIVNREVSATDDVINWHSWADSGVNVDALPWSFGDIGINTGAGTGTNTGANTGTGTDVNTGVGAGTGTDVNTGVGAGTGTDVKTIENALVNIGALAVAIEDIINGKPIPSSEVNIPKTPTLFDKFPFCLPKDVHMLLSVLVADPLEPKFNVNINGYTMCLDFKQFNPLFDFARSLIVVFFVYKIVLITKDVLQ